MWRLSLIFLAGSIALTVWLGYEVGVFGWTDGIASEKAAATTVSSTAVESDKARADVDRLEKALREREKRVADREMEMTKRERELADKQAIFGVEAARYEKIIQTLQKKLSDQTAQNNAKADGFRRLYEKMDTKKVASILEEIEAPLAGDILGGMNQNKAAEILSHMSNARVRLITEKFLLKRLTASSSGPFSDGAKKGQ